MNAADQPSQRITKFAPLADLRARIEALAPVPPREAALASACGCVLAADIIAPAAVPDRALALRDGWAVRAESVMDAGPYAPAPLADKPQWLEAGEPVPAGADAILPPEALVLKENGAEALASATPGDGILPAGEDAAAGAVLRRAGERLRIVDLELLRAGGIDQVRIRAPRIGLAFANARTAAFGMPLAKLIEASGGIADTQGGSLEQALASETVDAVFVIGGSGAGRRDKSVLTLARLGRVDFHGLALLPGETAAYGAAARPALILPGRFDAALAVFVTVGRVLIARLAGAAESEPETRAMLLRKISSQPGFAEFVVLRGEGDGVIPISTGRATLAALARADGWCLVPPESEGYPAGAEISMRPLP